jgi:prepilin-type N-terminal cleavage/methylation domain-containing protein
MRKRPMPHRFAKKKGMTLLELMIALSVLAVGLLALMGLLMTATATNNRNRVDTGGTFVAQQFMEAFMNQPNAGNVTIKDCAANTITVATAGPSTAGNSLGANRTADNRYIDFTQTASTITANYHASYTTCGSGGRTTTYDVRWNVRTIDTNSRMVIVSARHDLSNNGRSGGVYYQPPVTLRSVVSKF